MLKINTLLFISTILLLTGCSDNTGSKDNSSPNTLTKEEMEIEAPVKVEWEDLVPAEYRPEKIVAKYKAQLDKFESEDHSPEAEALYNKINDELKNAPVNKALNNKHISLPGFIAPLSQHNGVITEFLLVPYFGACIHVPPPPINQTVFVKVADNKGIKIDDSYGAFWVSGNMLLDGKKTDIGAAGYHINNAVIEPYDE